MPAVQPALTTVLPALTDLDDELRAAFRAWLRARATLRDPAATRPDNPLLRWAPLHDDAVFAQLAARADDPRSEALAAWLNALYIERRAWDARLRLACAWTRPSVLGEGGGRAPLAPRQLRRAMLRERDPTAREAAAESLREGADELANRFYELLEAQRGAAREMGSPPIRPQVAGADPDDALPRWGALELLARTDPLTARPSSGAWWEGLRTALGLGATEGWPARTSARWVREVFRKTVLARRWPAAAPALPEAWGALSFARGLGCFGIGLLDDARDESRSFATHQHPMGLRRHAWFALFASAVGERSFARRVLGLGRARAREHGRAVAAAFLQTLRIQSWRVVVADALASVDVEQAGDVHAVEGARVLGATPPRRLLGVVPRLRRTDGAALIGFVWASQQRRALIARFDEDWFHNPRAAEWLRDVVRAHSVEPELSREALEPGLADCVAALTEALR